MASASHITVRKRLAVVLFCVIVVIAGLSFRLGYLQLYRSEWLSENATDQRVRNIPVEPRRGGIYDRNGNEMAVSVSIESVYAIPAEINDVENAAASLAAILDLDQNKLEKKLKRRQAFTWIARKVSQDQADRIKKLDIAGIGLTEEGDRSYPNDNLAAHVIGFTGLDSQGLDGVELTFDGYLRGKKGGVIVEYDGGGREIPYAKHQYVAPVPGDDLYLTIDLVIQKIVERELDRIMQETRAKSATIVAMQPDTGEILALANRPDYDPNRFAEYAPKTWRNVAISNAFEPGSTFKILTTTFALGQKVVTPDDRFFDPGGIEVQGRTIHCWKHGGHGSQSFKQVVENSCNPGFVTVGLRLGADSFYEYLDRFGLGKVTGVDLPGEAKGIMINKNKVQPINLGTMAMGQSIAVTPLQLIAGVSAAVNGGLRVKPQIAKAVKTKEGEIVAQFQPENLERVVSEEVSMQVREILESVVANGTGKNAYIEGYRIGGKTGTAQKVGQGGYAPGKYIASFVGFAPADKPQIVMAVAIDEPEGLYYGGQIAAPAFKAAMQDVLRYLKAPEAPAKNRNKNE